MALYAKYLRKLYIFFCLAFWSEKLFERWKMRVKNRPFAYYTLEPI